MSDFKIDQQTLKDLNVFTAHSDSKSIYNLFKGTRTMGGRERLADMMRKPSSAINEITLRSQAIRYFYDQDVNLDIRNEELDLIEFYLKFDKRKSKSNLIDSVADYVTRNSSNDYYIIKTGLKYLIRLVRYSLVFIETHSSDKTPPHLQTLFEQMTSVITGGLLKQALSFNEDKLKFYQVNKLDKAFRGLEKEKLHIFLKLVYELDVIENVALVAKKLNFSFAEYQDQPDLNVVINGLFHPGITNPVKNDVLFNQSHNIVFLTGSNMAGKSSLLKSLGLVIYLSHLGFPVPATYMKTTIFNGLITTINLPDDINAGLSHYYSEVKRVKEVSLNLLERDRMFVIFDELFRGTNVKDAFDASLLVLSELSAIANSAFFISTHIVELAAELEKFDNISFKYLETYFKDKTPVFTYRLVAGVSEERLGMYIVLNEGIVDIIRQASARPGAPSPDPAATSCATPLHQNRLNYHPRQLPGDKE